MQLENSFVIQAPPDRVFAYLLDPHNVVGCVPGAELTEEVDAVTFKGKVKIKVGPITVAYSGTARMVDRDDAARTAVLEGEGRETTGPGSGRGKATMSVLAEGDDSRVTVLTEFTLTGRVAQFGRGVIEDVSKRMVRTVADCIQASLQSPGPPEPSEPSGPSSESLPTTEGDAPTPPAADAGTPPPRASTNVATATAPPINAASLMFSVLGGYVINPEFWNEGIKVLDRTVLTGVERLSERFESLVTRLAQVDR
jgi:carbon monoxide dehydrogenase subunit G